MTYFEDIVVGDRFAFDQYRVNEAGETVLTAKLIWLMGQRPA